jgi:hypothetical protein
MITLLTGKCWLCEYVLQTFPTRENLPVLGNDLDCLKDIVDSYCFAASYDPIFRIAYIDGKWTYRLQPAGKNLFKPTRLMHNRQLAWSSLHDQL